jgi:hypothetical protein
MTLMTLMPQMTLMSQMTRMTLITLMTLMTLHTYRCFSGMIRKGRREITQTDLTKEQSFVSALEAVLICREFDTFQRNGLAALFLNCLPSYTDSHPGRLR